MRIVHVVDAAQAQAQVHQRIAPPPSTSPPRRIQAVNRQAGSDDQSTNASSPADDGISLAVSPEAREAARQAALEELRASLQKGRGPGEESDAPEAEESGEESVVRELERRDGEVRAQGQAHAASVGGLASEPSFTYQVGPNGHLYAVSAEVKIDTTDVPGDPEATLRKAKQIEQAAFSPGDPSPEDRRAAVVAAALAARARQEMARRTAEEHMAAQDQDVPHIRETG